MQEYRITVQKEDALKRLDIILLLAGQAKGAGLSRTVLQRIIKEGQVSVNGVKLIKPHHKVREADVITLLYQEKQKMLILPEDITLDIVYEDKDLAVINKPSGLVVHPAPGNYAHTLVNALLYHYKKLSDINPQRPGIVHRLDKDTSGLIVIAKNNKTHLDLARQFAEHSIKRKYIAVVKGKMEYDENIIEIPIGRHPTRWKDMSAGFGKNPRFAKTYYRTLKRGRDCSLLQIEPFTGRTHQIRVHLDYLGHPVLGDSKYGKGNDFKRLALHAIYLGFIHPVSKKFMEFDSSLPHEFKHLVKSS
ncbi:MAG: RluA family pseudouridine synthase [Candidatus Omnitrophota bacterium]|nr:RluA family pseudouridine synthase [Candidatus Omnitrophota bacterium]